MRILVLAMAVLIGAGVSAWAQPDLAGKWSGTFDFITLGEKAGLGPAAVFQGELRPGRDALTMTAQGHTSLTVDEQLGERFYGEWSINDKKAR